MAKKQTSQPEPTTEEEAALKPVSPPISFEEPASQVREGVVFEDAEAPKRPMLTDREMQELRAAAEDDDAKREFALKIMAANAPEPEPTQFAGPVPPHVMEQTKAEMAAGAAAVKKQAEIDGQRPPRPVDPYNDQGRTTAVFRPSDYVPDPRKGQGNVPTRNL